MGALAENQLLPGLGIAGAVDVSDTATPQIEFPFFSRRHVDVFHWCGAQPWTFRNWFEDNFLTDVYAPFGSVFYFDGGRSGAPSSVMSNYAHHRHRPGGGPSGEPTTMPCPAPSRATAARYGDQLWWALAR